MRFARTRRVYDVLYIHTYVRKFNYKTYLKEIKFSTIVKFVLYLSLFF